MKDEGEMEGGYGQGSLSLVYRGRGMWGKAWPPSIMDKMTRKRTER